MMRIAAVAALFAGAMGQEAPGKIEATCEFTATSQTVEGGGITSGTMYITYVPGVGATTDVMTTGMTPGLHGIHIHDFGDLSDTVAGTSTGPHYNPLDEIHGCYPTPPGEVPGEVRPSPAAPSGCAAQRA
jgi:Cu-Zn family superoxide dismutase